MIEFTREEKSANSLQILDQEIDLDKFNDKGLPSDTHIVIYEYEGVTKVDAVRAYTLVDIFDTYYDKIKGQGKVLKIASGYGNIRPNLYGKIKSEQ